MPVSEGMISEVGHVTHRWIRREEESTAEGEAGREQCKCKLQSEKAEPQRAMV